jgi:putative membrane protein
MSTSQTGRSILRAIVVVLAIVLLFPLLMMVFAMPMIGMMGWWGGAGPSVGLSPLWGLGMMLLFLVVLVGIGYYLYRSLVNGTLNANANTNDPALEELRVAYARGDLSHEEFEQRRETLEQNRNS